MDLPAEASADAARSDPVPRRGLAGLSPDSAAALELVQLTKLMELTAGRAEVRIGIIDGPVALEHPELARASFRAVQSRDASCQQPGSSPCAHGTFIAGLLGARRDGAAPGLCPGCSVILRPLFLEGTDAAVPSAHAEELCQALSELLAERVDVINLSLAVRFASPSDQRALELLLNTAAQRGVLVVAAAGNQGSPSASLLSRHPWVLPVAACDLQGRPLSLSNLGASVGQRGLLAPGSRINSLGGSGQIVAASGTSVAAPFVTGTIALLRSLAPRAAPAGLRWALAHPPQGSRKRTIVPPLLNAWSAYLLINSKPSR